MSQFLKLVVQVFCFLGILFIPFPFHIFPYQIHITNFIFKPFLLFISETIFNQKLINPEISSDSTLMYILIIVLLFFSVLIALTTKTSKVFSPKFQFILRKTLAVYLALQLLKYGLEKVFKTQFYLPEPNILFTPFGQLDKDILYWSTMGTSYSYNLFLGLLEVFAASLILVNKTRTLGFLLAIGILLHIVCINFSFDISVKIYSSFLLLLSLVLLAPQISSLYQFFIEQKIIGLKKENTFLFKNRTISTFLKALMILMVITESFFPYLKNKNFNDDLAPRPYLHGAYQVTSKTSTIKRIFIHRNGYIIFQNNEDQMKDFQLVIDKISNQFLLIDYDLKQSKHPFRWNSKDSILQLKLGEGYIEAKAINWQKLPVLQSQFHWTID